MKKSIILFAAIFAVSALVFSCTKADEQTPLESVDPSNPNTNPVVEQGDGIYSLTLSVDQTKTYFGDRVGSTYPKKWSPGDQIVVNGIPSKPLEEGANTGTATFYFNKDISGATYQVVYPASAYSDGKVIIPESQEFVSGSFDKSADIILGYGTNPESITLTNAVAYLKIRLDKGDYGNFGVASIELNASGKKLNGSFDIADGGLALTVPSSSSVSSEQTTTLVAPGTLLSGESTEFLIAVAPQTLSSGFTVTITDTKGNTMEKSKAASVTLSRGRILAMPAFKFDEYVSIKTPADLLAFADSCSAGSSNYFVIERNIDMFEEEWRTAGIADDESSSFKGVLDGGNSAGYSISRLTSNTGAFINYLWSTGTVKNVTLADNCSIDYPSDFSSDLYVGSIVGKSRGTIKDCINNADVTCSSSTYSASLCIGGIVGLQEKYNPISGCTNNGNVSCSAAEGSNNIYMGGIAGCVICTESTDNATLSSCTNNGQVSRGELTKNKNSNSIHYVGGIIGWLKVGSSSHTFSQLKNYGDVLGPYYQTATNVPQFVGGLIGAFHGESASSGGRVKIEYSEVKNCSVKNEYRNNGTYEGASTGAAGYDYQCHNGGAIGFARGTDGNVTLDHITVDNVLVFSSRAFAGGLCGWVRGASIKDCEVINSQISGNQVFRAGGIAGCIHTVTVDGCTVKLNKTSTTSLDQTKGSSLYSGNIYQIGGIVGWLRETCTIKDSKAFIYNMCQSTVNNTIRGFIVGTATGDTTTGTIQDCRMGGTIATYDGGTKTFSVTTTLSSDVDITDDIIRGSGAGSKITISGENTYWDGTL